MKTLKFQRTVTTVQEVIIKINDEDQFKNEIEEWCSEGQSLNLWDLEEEHFCSVSKFEINDIDIEEDNDNFYVALEDELGIDDEWLENAEYND